MLAAGVQLRVGLEHTYGAGPCTSAHEEFDHCFQVRVDIIGHARINMYVNISHAWLKMAD